MGKKKVKGAKAPKKSTKAGPRKHRGSDFDAAATRITAAARKRQKEKASMAGLVQARLPGTERPVTDAPR